MFAVVGLLMNLIVSVGIRLCKVLEEMEWNNYIIKKIQICLCCCHMYLYFDELVYKVKSM